jgi:hypothetical protein
LEGLGRLVKAGLSAGWIMRAMQNWSDEVVSDPYYAGHA